MGVALVAIHKRLQFTLLLNVRMCETLETKLLLGMHLFWKSQSINYVSYQSIVLCFSHSQSDETHNCLAFHVLSVIFLGNKGIFSGKRFVLDLAKRRGAPTATEP